MECNLTGNNWLPETNPLSKTNTYFIFLMFAFFNQLNRSKVTANWRSGLFSELPFIVYRCRRHKIVWEDIYVSRNILDISIMSIISMILD